MKKTTPWLFRVSRDELLPSYILGFYFMIPIKQPGWHQ